MASTTGRQVSGKVRPPDTSAYYVASAAYNAGFRGWPLVIMTATALGESGGNPAAVNSADPNGGSYGLWQINGSHAPGGYTPSWAAQILSPSANAAEAYSLAGGNSLSGLTSGWYLKWNGQYGSTPVQTVPGAAYSIVPYMPTAMAAATAVEAFGAVSNATLDNVSAWPGAGTGVQVASGGYSTGAGGNASLLALNSGSGTLGGGTTATGCGAKGNGDTSIVSVLGFHFTYCNLKALVGGLALVGGGALCLVGLALAVYAGLGSHVQPAARLVRAVTSRGGGTT